MERIRLKPSIKIKKRGLTLAFKSAAFNSYLALMILILAGAVIGSVYINHSGVTKSGLEGTGFFMQDLLESGAASKGFVSLAVSAFFPVSMLMCASFIFGLCIIGFPFEILLPVIHGAWIGASMAAIDMRYGVRGLGICILFIMPQAIITSVAVMISAREGIRFSRSIAKTVFSGSQNRFNSEFRLYCYKYAVCFLLLVVASIIESFSIIIFSEIFFG